MKSKIMQLISMVGVEEEVVNSWVIRNSRYNGIG